MRFQTFLFFLCFSVTSIAQAQTLPAAPTDVVAYAPNQNRLHVSWVDNASDETGYRVERQVGTGAWTQVAVLPANFEVYRGFATTSNEETYKFRVSALKGASASPASESQMLAKPSGAFDLFNDVSRIEPTSNPEQPFEIPEGSGVRAGDDVSLQIEVYAGTPDSYVANNLAPGLTLNAATGLITGKVTTPGVYRMFIGVVFEDEKQFQRAHFLRVLPGVSTPEVANPSFSLPKQNIGVSGFIDISGLFKDPERPKGAWFYTASESIIVALYDTATPKTVDNFLSYAARGDYNNSYVHRSALTLNLNTNLPERFIFQGGGYKPASASAPPTAWARIIDQGFIQNEPGLSNRRGTISMAKQGGNRDSATSEWFFNVGPSNQENLNFQNGGFTAFGEVVGASSLGIVELIHDLPTGDYSNSITVNGVPSGALSQVPVLDAVLGQAPSTPGVNTLLRFDALVPAPPVVITLVSNSAPSVLTAGMEGMLLYVSSRGPIGTANLVLRATNLDGNSVDFTLPVSIDDVVGPGFRLTKIRGVNPPGTLLVKGRAVDAIGLGYWRYRINKGRWIRAQTLKGKTSPLTTRMKGFKKGTNLIEFEVFDARSNSSGILKQKITLG